MGSPQPQRTFSGQGFTTGSFYLRSDLTPDDRWLASTSTDGTVHLWDTLQPSESLTLGQCGVESTALSFSRQQGEPLRLAVGGEDGHLWLFKEDQDRHQGNVIQTMGVKPNLKTTPPPLVTSLSALPELDDLPDLPATDNNENERPVRKLTEWFKRIASPGGSVHKERMPASLGHKRKRQSRLNLSNGQSSWWASSAPASEI